MQTCRTSTLTSCVGNGRPHQLLLTRPATLGVHVHSDGAEAQQQLLAGNLHGTEGVQVLLGDEGQGVVLMVKQVDGGHIAVDAVEVIGNTESSFINTEVLFQQVIKYGGRQR